MTEQEQRIAITEVCGMADRWVLMKRGLYYRPNGCGYTNCISEAWIISEEEADKHTYPHDEPVTKHRAPLPDYLHDLNAMHEAEKQLTEEEALLFRLHLSGNSGKRHAEYTTVEAAMCHATAPERAEAFLRVKGLWRGKR